MSIQEWPRVVLCFVCNILKGGEYMIINENVEVTINGSNKEYWNKLGYKCSGKDKIIVNQKE